jgi:four helix bundle protein
VGHLLGGEDAVSLAEQTKLSERLLDFAVRVIRLVKALPKSVEGRHVARQILRSGTSPGANYEEACGAESRRDFAHKIGVVLKELKETRYWLRLARHVPLVKPVSRLDAILDETEQLVAIFGKSVSTARRSLARKRTSNNDT